MLKQDSITKTQKIRYLKLGVLSLLGFWGLWFGIPEGMASGQGVGVSVESIEVGQEVGWPYTVPITVTNLSAEEEQFEMSFETSENTIVSAAPGRFSLEDGAAKRVLVTFDPPAGGLPRDAEGLIKVLSSRTSPEGFTTGTGVKIPFHIEGSGNAKLLAGVAQSSDGFGFQWLFGGGLILLTIILLWQVAAIVRSWIFSLGKQ